MSNFIELEYKYRADNVKLTDFIKLIEKLDPDKRLDISSWDIYYTKTEDKESFQRFRQSDHPELTKKVKVKNANNWERVEADLPLDASRLTEEIVAKYVELDGYHQNFKIYKTCIIFWLDYVNYVYYIVYDENLKEEGRFIEVEVNKDKVNYLRDGYYDDRNNTGPKDGAVEYLNTQEKALEKLGITPQHRMKKSLFEMYVREK